VTAVAAGLFALALALLLFSYAVYPPLVRRLAAQARLEAGEVQSVSSVEVLVSVADEEAVIGDRLRNLLGQSFAGRYAVAVGCDGSSDRSAAVAYETSQAWMTEKAAADPRPTVRVVTFPERRGKAAVLNDLAASSQAEVLVFTDANTHFEAEAVARLAAAFADPAVGAACGRLILEGSDAESVFWDRETRVKEAEGRLGICLGANGAIYAARRSEVAPLPLDTTSIDDFLIPLHIARRRLRIVFVPEAVAREAAPRDSRAEMGRRFRIGVGAGQVLRRERWPWNIPRWRLLSLAFLSRKVARWLAPVAAFAACAAACASRALWPFGAGLAAAAGLLALSSLARPRPRGLFGKLYYFSVINLALGAGVLAGLFGYSRPVWKPVARGT
jgi:cellulose synthase/poly-beta-1,6-N-acetylglucosamine synthase-like glycosyltransferase